MANHKIKTSKTFGRKGIHPSEMKLTSGNAIKDLPLPRRVDISLSQSIGRPAKAAVAVGDHVSRFDLIGEAQGPISANVHTPITGTVKAVGLIASADGHGSEGIVIEASEADHIADLQGISDARPATRDEIERLSGEEILETIRRAGIVGMGGATFPTAAKLTLPQGSRCEYLLINGAECEPYLTCDEAIMMEMGSEIIVGIELMLKVLGDDVECIIGIEGNKPGAYGAMSRLAERIARISVKQMSARYPPGREDAHQDTDRARDSAGSVAHNAGRGHTKRSHGIGRIPCRSVGDAACGARDDHQWQRLPGSRQLSRANRDTLERYHSPHRRGAVDDSQDSQRRAHDGACDSRHTRVDHQRDERIAAAQCRRNTDA